MKHLCKQIDTQNGDYLQQTKFKNGLSKIITIIFIVVFFAVPMLVSAAEIGGVTFKETKTIGGKTLKLNGVAIKKALIFIKVYAGGFYTENKITTADEAIKSEQVKQIMLHYLTSKATAKKIQKGFVELMEKANPKDVVERQRANLEKHTSWLVADMQPGYVSTTTYIPGKGLTFALNGDVKGTIKDKEYIQMYFRYCFGDKAEENIRNGYLVK